MQAADWEGFYHWRVVIHGQKTWQNNGKEGSNELTTVLVSPTRHLHVVPPSTWPLMGSNYYEATASVPLLLPDFLFRNPSWSVSDACRFSLIARCACNADHPHPRNLAIRHGYPLAISYHGLPDSSLYVCGVAVLAWKYKNRKNTR